jgi:hypothetical protein
MPSENCLFVATNDNTLFEIARVLVRLDHVPGFIVNANERNFADKSASKAYNCFAGVGYGHSFSI